MAQRVLVVDDDPTLLHLEVGILARAGYEVDRATSGEEALDKLGTVAYQAISLDIGLPGVDGYEVTRQIRARPGPNRTTPVILVTATSDDQAARRGFDVGAVMFLTKPFAASVYRSTLASVIGLP